MLYAPGEQYCRKNKNDQNMKPVEMVIVEQGLRDKQKWLEMVMGTAAQLSRRKRSYADIYFAFPGKPMETLLSNL